MTHDASKVISAYVAHIEPSFATTGSTREPALID